MNKKEKINLALSYGGRANNSSIIPESRRMEDAILGLAGEVGEIAELIKKFYRDCPGEVLSDSPEMLKKIKSEIGDVLWYANSMAIFATGRSPEDALFEIMENNLEKVEGRMQRGTINGSGDNR